MVGFPLLLIPLAIYNIIVFLMPGVSFTDPLVKLTLMSGAEWPVTLSDVLLDARHPAAARRSHQGRAARREISHRPSAVADRVRRGGGRIRAVAEVRHLDLFPADGAGAGGFPVRPCLAHAAPRRCGGGAARRQEDRRKGRGAGGRTPAPIPRRQRLPRPAAPVPAAASVAESVLQDHPEPKPAQPAVTPEAAPVVPEVPSPKTPSPKPRQPEASSPEVPSPGLQPGWRFAGIAGQASALSLDGLPRPEAGAAAPDLAGAIGGLRIRQRSPPQAAGLRRLVGGRDQLGDEAWIGPRRRSRRPVHGLGHRHQLDAGRSSRLTNSPSRISSDRSISSIAHRNRLNCHVLGRYAPLRSDPRKAYAAGFRFVPAGSGSL